ncbi:MAG: hypothetical protein FWD84_05930, partial [Oscillospiraceae bacterium]|nr:hypothetical protein [Oscillospiraceae bacterium]
MRKTAQRTIGLLLAVLMLISLFPAAALATMPELGVASTTAPVPAAEPLSRAQASGQVVTIGFEEDGYEIDGEPFEYFFVYPGEEPDLLDGAWAFDELGTGVAVFIVDDGGLLDAHQVAETHGISAAADGIDAVSSHSEMITGIDYMAPAFPEVPEMIPTIVLADTGDDDDEDDDDYEFVPVDVFAEFGEFDLDTPGFGIGGGELPADNLFIVTVGAYHPETGERFTRERSVRLAMGIMPLNTVDVTTWAGLRAAVIAAGATPTTIRLMEPYIPLSTGYNQTVTVAGIGMPGNLVHLDTTATAITIGATQNITIINGLTGGQRVVLDRNRDINQGATTNDSRHFVVNGRLTIGNPANEPQSRITLDNTSERRWNASPTDITIVDTNTISPDFWMGADGRSLPVRAFVSATTSVNNHIWGGDSTQRGGIRLTGHASSHLTINDGVVIQFARDSQHGPAVRIQGQSGSSFTMNGGSLRQNVADSNRGGVGHGGAVQVSGASTFTMNGGT